MAHGVSSVASALETILAFTDQCLYSAEHIRAFADNFVAGEHFICEARDAIVGGIVGGNGRPDLEEILRVLHRIQPTVPRVVLRRNIRSDHGEGAEDVQNLVGGDTASWIPCPGLLRSEFIHQILPQCIRYLCSRVCVTYGVHVDDARAPGRGGDVSVAWPRRRQSPRDDTVHVRQDDHAPVKVFDDRHEDEAHSEKVDIFGPSRDPPVALE